MTNFFEPLQLMGKCKSTDPFILAKIMDNLVQKNCNFPIDSPTLQVAPVHPGAHSQLKDPPSSKQVPPCRQGAGAHGLSTVSQFIPENPSGQVHMYLSGAVFSQVPPLMQGSWVPQKFKSEKKQKN